MTGPAPTPSVLPVGAQVGVYEITGVLRRGVLGTVYSARSARQGGEVALEILHDPSPDPARLARFQREASLAGKVGHAAILAPVEQGILPDGRAYALLEKLEGESLQARLDRRGAVPLAEAAPWLDALMEALGAAHAAGLVHRNLTPTNLFLQGGPHGQARIRVLDFGVSQLGAETAQLGLQITKAGQVMGSPPHMAPEQASASYGGVGPWTDVYALGTIAFHLLTGHPPYVAAKAGEVLLAHLQAPIPSLREHRPGMPPGLDAVLRQAMAKRPEERFATMDAFRRAFRGSVRGSVVLPVVPGIDDAAAAQGARRDPTGVPPPADLGTDRTLPPSAALGTDDTVPPFAGPGGPPGGARASAATAPTLDPAQRVAWAQTLRPEAFHKAPEASPAPALQAPVSPWTKDQDSLERHRKELEARALPGLGPQPGKAAEPELRRAPEPAPAPLPPLPAPRAGHVGLWLVVGVVVLAGLGALIWYVVGR